MWTDLPIKYKIVWELQIRLTVAFPVSHKKLLKPFEFKFKFKYQIRYQI